MIDGALSRDVAAPGRPICAASFDRASILDALVSEFRRMERVVIVAALKEHRFANRAAKALGITDNDLTRRMTALGIERALRTHKADTMIKLPVPPTRMPRLKKFVPIDCPCCRRPVNVPTLDIVIDHYKVPTCEQRVLRAVWNGKGHPVQTERIFSAMYADDPDGGPSPDAMYRAFKALLHNIRVRLAGSGITIENVGYRMGYRIVIGDDR